MLSLSSFLGGLPPASLAIADLPRFLTRVLNRLSPAELEEIRAVVGEQPLSGYPAALGACIDRLIATILEEEIDPGRLDPETIDHIMSRRSWRRSIPTAMSPAPAI